MPPFEGLAIRFAGGVVPIPPEIADRQFQEARELASGAVNMTREERAEFRGLAFESRIVGVARARFAGGLALTNQT